MWAGIIPARTVITYISQLTAIPHSRVYGLAGGTPELQGWDVATMVATRTHNLIAGLVAGLSKGVDLDRILITVPTPEQPDPEPQTLADFIRTHVDGGALDEFFAP